MTSSRSLPVRQRALTKKQPGNGQVWSSVFPCALITRWCRIMQGSPHQRAVEDVPGSRPVTLAHTAGGHHACGEHFATRWRVSAIESQPISRHQLWHQTVPQLHALSRDTLTAYSAAFRAWVMVTPVGF